MLDQTPVQIAWVTGDLDTTEKALTTLLGAKKWVREPDVHFKPDKCTYGGRPADFVTNNPFSYAGDTQLALIEPVSALAHGAEVVQRGVVAGGREFAYVDAEAAGVPYIEIAHMSPETRAFFDYVKQEQQ